MYSIESLTSLAAPSANTTQCQMLAACTVGGHAIGEHTEGAHEDLVLAVVETIDEAFKPCDLVKDLHSTHNSSCSISVTCTPPFCRHSLSDASKPDSIHSSSYGFNLTGELTY